ncbi:hypothetical protein Tco_0393400 [Tanacetum coccineum]
MLGHLVACVSIELLLFRTPILVESKGFSQDDILSGFSNGAFGSLESGVAETLWSNPNRDEKSRSAGIEVVVVSVVGVRVGVGVECCGRGVIGGIVGRMVSAAIVEVSGITVTGMVRKDGV